MADRLLGALHYVVTIVLCKKGTQPSQTCSEGHATEFYWGVSLYLRIIDQIDFIRPGDTIFQILWCPLIRLRVWIYPQHIRICVIWVSIGLSSFCLHTKAYPSEW